ncbi:MAG: GNAT family N-acetyltransferase [Anaerolineae bacterium]|nr:GNAT family N-acetyltransferase [Anaerolineae bacterium]
MSDYQLIERLPTVDEHRVMFEAVGWTPYAPQAAEVSLKNSLFSVVVEQDSKVIGIGRVIGDGGKFFYIQDVAVLPDLQGQGIGQLIMDRLIDWIKTNAPHEPFVGLFATEVAQKFYQRYGFDERREVLSGMWAVLPVDNTK